MKSSFREEARALLDDPERTTPGRLWAWAAKVESLLERVAEETCDAQEHSSAAEYRRCRTCHPSGRGSAP